MGQKKKVNQHPTKSFQQLVAEAALNVVKPYVNETFANMANDLSRRIFKQQANMQTRVMAVEEVLIAKFGVTQKEIEEAVMDIEDAATGYETVDRTAVPGDLLRVSVRVKTGLDGTYGEVQKHLITNLMNLGQDPTAPLSLGSPTIEGALVGMGEGALKAVTLEDYTVELYVDRISAKRMESDEVPKSTEVADASQNA